MNFIGRLAILSLVIAYYVGVRTFLFIYVFNSPLEGPAYWLSWWFAIPISVVVAFVIYAVLLFLIGEKL